MRGNALAFELNQNERRVLDAIWRSQPISRLALASETGLTTGAVTRITTMLIERGLLAEDVIYSGARGNPPRPLSIRPDGGHAFGVSFSHTYMDVGLVALSGAILDSERITYSTASPSVLRERIAHCIGAILDRTDPLPNLFGVGIAVPGEFTTDRPSIRAHPYFPQLDGIDLAKTFQGLVDLPVWIENDCNAAALGERLLGWGLRYRTFVNVFLCHGVGGGIVIDGMPFRGSKGNAGGIHSFFPLAEPRPSGQDLFDVLARETEPVRDFNDLERDDVLALPGIAPWIARAAAQLQVPLTRIARLIDPDAIIIGGRLPSVMLESIAAQVKGPGFCTDTPLGPPELVASKIGGAAGVVGAAATAMFATIMSNGKRNVRDNWLR
jgi:predicted NBD/HSP70 family sugar kinase